MPPGTERHAGLAERAVAACEQSAGDPAIASDPTALEERYAALARARAAGIVPVASAANDQQQRPGFTFSSGMEAR